MEERYLSATLNGGKLFKKREDAIKDYETHDDEFKGVFEIIGKGNVRGFRLAGTLFNDVRKDYLKEVAKNISAGIKVTPGWNENIEYNKAGGYLAVDYFNRLAIVSTTNPYDHKDNIDSTMKYALFISIRGENHMLAESSNVTELREVAETTKGLISHCMDLRYDENQIIPIPANGTVKVNLGYQPADHDNWSEPIPFEELEPSPIKLNGREELALLRADVPDYIVEDAYKNGISDKEFAFLTRDDKNELFQRMYAILLQGGVERVAIMGQENHTRPGEFKHYVDTHCEPSGRIEKSVFEALDMVFDNSSPQIPSIINDEDVSTANPAPKV